MKKFLFMVVMLFSSSVFAVGAELEKKDDQWFWSGTGIRKVEVTDDAIAVFYTNTSYQTLGVNSSRNSVLKNASVQIEAISMPGWAAVYLKRNGEALSPYDVPSGSKIWIGSYADSPPAPTPSRSCWGENEVWSDKYSKCVCKSGYHRINNSGRCIKDPRDRY